MRSLLIDNYDSYSYNLFQLMAGTFGVVPTVLTNDAPEWDDLDLTEYGAVVVSPGPGRPQRAADVGRCLEVLRGCDLPVLGVCLGHQMLALLAGADVVPAPAPRHGFLDRVWHDGRDLFAGLPQGFRAVRYHSLCVADPPGAGLVVTARGDDGVIMGLRHRDRPWWGTQFHPESILTEHGDLLLRNFQRLLGPRPVGLSAPRAGTAPRWRVLSLPINRAIDTEQAFTSLFAESPAAFWLDSSRRIPGLSRFSFLGDGGGPFGETLTASVAAGTVTVRDAGGRTEIVAGSIFDVLEERLRARAVPAPPELPFDLPGGYVGYLGYELKAQCGARENRHASAEPDAVWLAATRFLAVDHDRERAWLVALWDGGTEHFAAIRTWMAETHRHLVRPAPRPEPAGQAGPEPGIDPGPGTDPGPWLRRPRRRYLDDIAECRRLLRLGESYEICLTNTVEGPAPEDPLAAYLRLRRVNPAPYAAYLRFGDVHVLCSSPERFLKVGRDRTAEARPIKGTAPRHADPARDAALRAQLAADPKTRAENLMIVDLLRNDLGRVCDIGTVEVPSFAAVESYATVHQLVSIVRGRLRDDVGAVRAARHCFPGGSMTGAPKLRTMEIIDRLEDRARGIYSGALGYFGLSGTADLNIVIRTAVVHGDRLAVGAGGAIVLDSDPDGEYEEMLLKARAPLRALGIGAEPTVPRR